jgi:hypothetical protein
MAKIFIETNAEGEVISWATSRGNDAEIEFEIEDTHPIFSGNPFHFKLTNGVLADSEELRTKIRERRSNQREILDLKSFLAETDFYFIRRLDDNTPIPADIQAKRNQARARLKQLGL